jgi:putative nucleotidyltransferase with HDIG domain
VTSRPSDQEIAQRALELVLRRIDADDLDLPALPMVAARCLEILYDPDFSLREVASVMETDPLVAARVVRLANSAGRASLEPARSVLQAVMRLGADELRQLMIEISAKPIFESKDARIGAVGRTLWTHSVAVALLASDLARPRTKGHPEAAYLAGLLHDVGKPIMAVMLLNAEKRLFGTRTQTWLTPATWLKLVGASHRRIGVALATAWNLPELVRKAIEKPPGAISGATDPAAAIALANALTKLAGIYAGDVDADQVEAQILTGRGLFGLSQAQIDDMTETLRDRVEERLA